MTGLLGSLATVSEACSQARCGHCQVEATCTHRCHLERRVVDRCVQQVTGPDTIALDRAEVHVPALIAELHAVLHRVAPLREASDLDLVRFAAIAVERVVQMGWRPTVAELLWTDAA